MKTVTNIYLPLGWAREHGSEGHGPSIGVGMGCWACEEGTKFTRNDLERCRPRKWCFKSTESKAPCYIWLAPGKKAQGMESCQCVWHYEPVQVMVQYRMQVHITQLSSVSTPNPSHVFPGQSQSQANPKVFQHSMIIVKVEDTDFINRVTGNKEKRKKEKRGA